MRASRYGSVAIFPLSVRTVIHATEQYTPSLKSFPPSDTVFNANKPNDFFHRRHGVPSGTDSRRVRLRNSRRSIDLSVSSQFARVCNDRTPLRRRRESSRAEPSRTCTVGEEIIVASSSRKKTHRKLSPLSNPAGFCARSVGAGSKPGKKARSARSRARVCAATSHAHASCIVTWYGSPTTNEPLLLLPFVAAYVFPATSGNTNDTRAYKALLSLWPSRVTHSLSAFVLASLGRPFFSLPRFARLPSFHRRMRGVVHTK